VDDRIQLVFSWDPRAQVWLKERGPDNSAKPPAKPLDDGAVQTYFLDPQSGRWEGTILGARARTIGNELGAYYRSPGIVGLAVEDYKEPPRPGMAVEQKRRPVMPFAVVGGVILALVVGAGVVASKTVFAPAADTQAAATAPGSVPAASASDATAPTASAPASAPQATAAPSSPSTTAPKTPTPTAPPRTAAPTPLPQPTTVILSTTTVQSPTGLKLFYSGPNMAPQGTVINVTVNALYESGEPYRYAIDVRIGNTGWSSMATRGDGKYTAALPLIAAKGQQAIQLNVHFGNIITPYTLGTMVVQ
jgi:hypothetical protein